MRALNKIAGVEVETISEVVEEIIDREGVCPPGRLVDESRPEDSPTHNLFEWDDSVAAEAYRTEQARRVIRSIPLKVADREEMPPRFVHVRKVTETGEVREGYERTIRALSGDTREGVLADALGQLKGLQARFGGLSELAPIWQGIEEVEQEIGRSLV